MHNNALLLPLLFPPGPRPAQPYLTVRLDVTQLLPMSASFFKEKQLAVSAGLPAAVAEDLATDRVLVEQGLISEAELEAKWSMEEMSVLRFERGAWISPIVTVCH